MGRDTELVIKINGDIKGYQDALKSVTDETKNLQKSLKKIAKTGAVAFAGFAGAIGLSTAQFAEFDNGLRGVKTLLDESSFSTKTLDEGFQDLSKGALQALSDFPLTLESINKSLFDIVSAGIPAAQAIDVLGSTSRLAVAGITDSATATDAVTSALNAYGLSAKESEAVAAKFFTAQKFGKTTIQELGQFFGRAASTAAAYGVSLDELLASTAAMTVGGIKTAAAMTAIPAIMVNIAKPTQDAKDEAERLGIEFDSTALRAQGLAGFLDTLTAAQGFNKASIEKLFSSVEAQKGIFALTGGSADKFKETLNALSDSQQILTTFTEAYETQSQSLKNEVKVLGNNFQALGILIGKDLAPIVSELAKVMTGFLKFLQENPALATFISKALIAGTVTAGLTTVVGLGGLAFLKFRGILKITTLALKADRAAKRAAALATWGLGTATKSATKSTNLLKFAVKGLIGSTGIGLLIAFLPEIIQLFQWAFGGATKTVEEEKEKQRKLLEENNKETKKEEEKHGQEIIDAQSKVTDTKLQKIKDENERIRAMLDGLEKEEVNFLKRRQDIQRKAAEAEKETDQGRKDAALENVKLLSKQLLKEEELTAEKRNDIEVDRILKQIVRDQKEEEAAEKRIQNLKNENELLKAGLDDLGQKELEFLKRGQELANEKLEAQKNTNDKERELALENVQLKNDELFEEEIDFLGRLHDLEAEQAEIEAAVQAELDALSTEKRKALQEAELEDIKRTFETKEKIRSKAVKKELIDQRKENELRAKEEEQFGEIIATTKAFFRKDEFTNAQTAAGQLAQLQQSENATQKTIGKAAALVQIGLNTQKGAIAAYSALAGIPVVGPALGAAAAAALVAFGIERAAKVQAAQAGGLVAGTGFGDRVPFLLEPGELITPRQNFEEVITAVADQRATRREAEGVTEPTPEEANQQEILVGFDGEEAADVLTIRQNEQTFLGVSQRIAI